MMPCTVQQHDQYWYQRDIDMWNSVPTAFMKKVAAAWKPCFGILPFLGLHMYREVFVGVPSMRYRSQLLAHLVNTG